MCVYHQLGWGLKKPRGPKDGLEQPKNEPATDDVSQDGYVQLVLKLHNENEPSLFQKKTEYRGDSTHSLKELIFKQILFQHLFFP